MVICFDQMGPVSLRPTPGAGWAPRKRPERQRADYNRRAGTRYVFGAYDVHARPAAHPPAPAPARARHARVHAPDPPAATHDSSRLYWIQDNLSANWTPDIREFADANRIELVPTPTYASYLNPIECHFTPISQFVVEQRRLPRLGRLRLRARAPHPATATAPIAIDASPNSNAATASPPDMPLRVQPFLKGH